MMQYFYLIIDWRVRTRFFRGSTRKQKLTFAEVGPGRQSRQRKGQGGELMDCLMPGEGHELISAPHTVLSEMETEPVLVSSGTDWFQGVLLSSLLLGSTTISFTSWSLSLPFFFSPQVELWVWKHLVCWRLK